MPSPFPGMDPYLEDVRLWRGVHGGLIYALNAALNRALPRSFVARIEERVYIQEENRNVYPDIAVARRPTPPGNNGRVAVAERQAERNAPVRLRLPSYRMREHFVEVFTAGANERLITVVEVLSPTNKISGTGWEEYRRKQHELRERGINLLEIDLLRGGQHTVLAPVTDLQEQVGSWDYLVSLYQASRSEECMAWSVGLRDNLPTVTVPLMEDAESVEVDLQAAIRRVYDEGAFDRSIDYTAEPEPPLSPEDAVWADALLREAGLRT